MLICISNQGSPDLTTIQPQTVRETYGLLRFLREESLQHRTLPGHPRMVMHRKMSQRRDSETQQGQPRKRRAQARACVLALGETNLPKELELFSKDVGDFMKSCKNRKLQEVVVKDSVQPAQKSALRRCF